MAVDLKKYEICCGIFHCFDWTAGLIRIVRARGFLEASTLSENWVCEMWATVCWKHTIRPISKARG